MQNHLDSGFFSDSSVDEQFLSNSVKIKKIQDQMREIKTAKHIFIRKALGISRMIDNVVENMSVCAQANVEILRSRLTQVKTEKMIEWTRQLKICENAEKSMRTAERFYSNNLFNYYSQSIGFIDPGEIKFEARDHELKTKIENFGKLTVSDETITEKPEPKLIIEKTGKKGIMRPWGVCFDAAQRILVTDCGTNKVLVFNKTGILLFSFGKSGSHFGHFSRPEGIATFKKSRIIIADRNNHRVQIFTFAGMFLTSFGKKGTEAGEFKQPRDIAVSGDGKIAVSDYQNHRIQLFNKKGNFIAKFPFSNDTFDVNLKIWPLGVAFRPDGSLLVTDVSNKCVFLIDKNFSDVVKILDDVLLSKPQGVACDNKGTTAISDNGHQKIQVFDNQWNLLKSYDVREFGVLLDICLLPDDGGMIASNFKHKRVLVF